MAMVTTQQMLTDAQQKGYAVGAFNIENMEMAQAVISAAEKMHAPVILQTTPTTVKYAKPRVFSEMVKAIASEAMIPVAMHLDHGESFEAAMRAFHDGYTSIMIDGSKLPFEDNVALTRSVVTVCHSSGIPVEAELGCIGGKEDSHVSLDSIYTDPDMAALFTEQSGADFLAVAIGTAHGVYKGKPKLDIPRLKQIREKVSKPLVLHGTSGIADDVVKECIRNGICKVNYATDLRIAFTKGVKEVMEQTPDVFDPKKYNARGRALVENYVMERMEVLGCRDQA